MNLPLPRHYAAVQAAAHRVKLAAREAVERCVDSLGIAALSSTHTRDRDDLLAAQFELNRKLSSFVMAFNESLDQRIEREAAPRHGGPRTAQPTGWESLSLVEDHEVEAQVSADRFGMAIQHACEWELRELDAYMGSLLQLGRPDQERNPLRPEVVGKALVAGVDAVTDRPEVRKALAAEMVRSLTSTMPKVYGEIVAELRASGVQPVSLTVRTVKGPGNELGRNTSGYETLDRPVGLGVDSGSGGSSGGGESSGGGPHSGSGADSGGFRRSGRGALAAEPAGTPFGQVDVQLMSLIRRLATLGPMAAGTGAGAPSGAEGAAASPPRGAGPVAAPNLIYTHREELRQASTGTLDHMVIDVVGSLFEQILSDPKVPPQMARQIARLQLPVLRVALGDNTFFSSRRHPVRRFVNRIASLACGVDDFEAGPGAHFLDLVRDLVQEIVSGDFDQMEVYEQKLDALEIFIVEQAQREVEAHDPATPELLVGKEQALRVQQRYMQQLQVALTPVELPAFLREFLTQVWSQAIVQAAQQPGAGGETGELAMRMKHAGRELVMSVQSKGSPADRKNFLLQLPKLMKDLNEGLIMIGWPETAKKGFFAQLLPAHAESLKGQSLRRLDHNLLVKQLDAILGAPLPKAGEMPRLSATLPVLNDAVEAFSFNAEEAARIGLVRENSVDWDGQVDVDLSAEPELSEVDIELDGMPPAEPPEPTRGASLADHIQLGFVYQMHLDGEWQKVKLSYLSPGRSFFVFTRGQKHQQTISMTARMLVRLCESGRLRAFENAYLIERATARARSQLAALRSGPAPLTRH